ncbi:MAG: hypothetical protein Q9166_000884 [cf. Caloplaca sp. 2 TL-2023]
MSFAPPIARDGFYYNGDLYVEVGNLNRHKRASIPEIIAILRPDLQQSTATQATLPSKDPVGHWYEAQLIHYGLPPSKDKARAKMRLLEALNTSKLEIPAQITQLETQLKKEFAAADKRAKAQYKAEMVAVGKQEPTPTTKKRKQPEPSNTVNVNINFGPSGGSPYQMSEAMALTSSDVTRPSTKKAKTFATTTPKSVVATAKKTNPEKTGNSKAAKEKGTPSKNAGCVEKKAVSKAPVATQEENTAKKAASCDPTPVRPKQTAKKSAAIKKEPAPKKEAPLKKEPAVKKEAPVKKDRPIKQESNVKKELSTSSQPKLGLINGYYEIYCPYLQEQFSHLYDEPMSLILCLNSPNVWGAYDFGMFSGVLHMQGRPWEPSEEPIPCRWRGRENGEGEMSFGDNCRGEIAFLGDGNIQGSLNLFGECHFSGRRRPGPGTAPRSAASMQDEWDGYNEEACEYERVNRW